MACRGVIHPHRALMMYYRILYVWYHTLSKYCMYYCMNGRMYNR